MAGDCRTGHQFQRRHLGRRRGRWFGPQGEGRAMLAGWNARRGGAETGRYVVETKVNGPVEAVHAVGSDGYRDSPAFPNGGRSRTEADVEARPRRSNRQPIGKGTTALAARIADAHLVFAVGRRVEKE